MALEVFPSIDLRNGQVVRLQQGDYGRQITYAVEPAAVAASYAEAGAAWMHVVDLDGAKEGRPVQTDLLAALARASGLRVQVGGGIRATADVDRLLAAGVARVVVGTAAFERWDWFRALAHDPAYAGRLVLAIDAKEGVIAKAGWTQSAGRLAADVAREVSDWPLAALLYTDVAKDGMLLGPNVEQTRALATAGRVPVIASGGVGSVDHVRQLRDAEPIWGVIVGRSLYEGKVDLREALRVARSE
ncbi:MAG TPA: 1-(5-phosphoribosyl)-5-[(5-phosphoribosylamino)methylideneamino]imidazole-4-carboxamide isomerase [Tepidisphaeraceae bacterium]|nr:1-(5-phosphoribosyl)-5-[(5-phosphoribosylamino)methylideneamino]imidazole-4-carboxamide isomerase [Tepidisphaeraceae bacterium]